MIQEQSQLQKADNNVLSLLAIRSGFMLVFHLMCLPFKQKYSHVFVTNSRIFPKIKPSAGITNVSVHRTTPWASFKPEDEFRAGLF